MNSNRTFSALAVALATLGIAPAGPRLPAARTEPLRRTLRAGARSDCDISYLVAGNPAGQRVILVHGTPGTAQGWTDYLLEPPPGLELIAVDRPGFGRSGPGRAQPALAAQAAALAALLPTGGRRAVLLGHSLGGAIAARVAAEHAEAIAALVLLASSLDPSLERIHPLQSIGSWAPLRAMLPRAIRNANAELMALRQELEQLQPLLPRITAPVLIVHGSDDDLVPVANVPYIEANLRGARCRHTRLLPGRNHFLPWNAEAEVRSALAWAASPPC